MEHLADIVTLPGVGSWSGKDWAAVHDVLVVGSGAAAFSAAITATHEGADVLMVEKRRRAGGTTRRSGGQYWVPGNTEMRSAGYDDDAEEALHYMARLSFPAQYRPDHPTLGLPAEDHTLLVTYLEHAPRVIDFLGEVAGIRSEMSVLAPDFGAWSDRLQRDYHVDLQPEPRIGRHLNVHQGVGGEDLIDSLASAAERFGIPIVFNHRVVGIAVTEAGRAVGLLVETEEGLELLGARKGIVFGSGGFAHNPELAASQLRGPLMGSCAIPSNTGDFQQLAALLGADMGHMDLAWWNQVAVEDALANPKSPAAVWLPYGDSMMIVNRHGQRVVNEKAIYNERSQVHFAWDPAAKDYTNRLLFMLFDQSVVDTDWAGEFRWPVPFAKERPAHVIRGDWWEELAERIEGRLERLGSAVGHFTLAPEFFANLLESVERFNEFAKQGIDRDFHRHETPLMAWHGPPRPDHDGHPLLHPFPIDGPFYCVILGLGALDTKGGPRIDVHGRVRRPTGEPIQGLYGAGNCVCSPAAQAYWSAGATIGLALTFGSRAGSHAAGMPEAPAADFPG